MAPRYRTLYLLLIAVAGMAVLVPGLHGPFILDDFSNIANNQALQVDDWNSDAFHRAALTNQSGPLGRPVSMLSFAAEAATWGVSPFRMKLTNTALHGLAAVLAALLAARLFEVSQRTWSQRKQVVAGLFAGLIWAVHPIAVTSTLYVVQRMNLLSALFVLAALVFYVIARRWFFTDARRSVPWLVTGFACWMLGIFSKENAALLPLYIFLLEWLVFRFSDNKGAVRPAWRKSLVSLALAGIAVGMLVFFLMLETWTAGAENRGFTMGERLLTEARVIWHYIGMVLLPSHGRLGLFLDDIPLSTDLLSPVSTILSIAGLIGVTAAAIILRRRFSLASFGVLFFLAGHLVESTVVPLEIAFEHRNYLPSFGLIIAISALTVQLATRLRVNLLEWLPQAAFAAFLIFFTVIRSIHWGDEYLLAQLEAFHHPKSARAQTQLGFVYTQFARQAKANGEAGWPRFYMEAAIEPLEIAASADPETVTPLFLRYLHSRAHGLEFPQTAFEQLLDRLHQAPPGPSLPGNLDMVFECVMEGCGAEPLELETFLRVALQNEKLTGRIRGETLVVAAKYFRYIRKDDASAVALLAEAVENAPGNPRFRLFLANRLLATGDTGNALVQTRKAAELDKWDMYEADIRALLIATTPPSDKESP